MEERGARADDDDTVGRMKEEDDDVVDMRDNEGGVKAITEVAIIQQAAPTTLSLMIQTRM